MLFGNILLFLAACGFMWISSNLITQGIENFSKNIKISSFLTSFLILRILTSITEISVGINALLEKTPTIFVGNLIGSSFVILLFIIPLLAIFNNGISFRHHFNLKKFLFFLALLIAPSVLILDNDMTRFEAALLIILYVFFLYLFQKEHEKIPDDEKVLKKVSKKEILINLCKIIGGAILIYFSSHILVEKTVYFAEFIKVPTFLVSILILSVGTNLPELTIAINSVFKKHSEIALGDYIGSAAANSFLFGLFAFMNGPFTLEPNHFDFTFMIMLVGYTLFFFFFRSKNSLSIYEAIILMLVYTLFLLFQGSDIMRVSPVL